MSQIVGAKGNMTTSWVAEALYLAHELDSLCWRQVGREKLHRGVAEKDCPHSALGELSPTCRTAQLAHYLGLKLWVRPYTTLSLNEGQSR